jgi:ABC-type antimicrobial peptide transport system permease subunit
MLRFFFISFKAYFVYNRAFNVLNILGLAFGICSSLLIYLWVTDELGYDRFHRDAENVYRLIKVDNNVHGEKKTPLTPAPLGLELKNNFPNIIEAASIYGNEQKYSIAYKNNIAKFKVWQTNSGFFKVFDFPIVQGVEEDMYRNNNSAVISSTCAKILFGNENPIGKIIEDDFFKLKYEVTAVVEIPQNSHLRFDILTPFAAHKTLDRIRHQWNAIDAVNYIKLADNASFNDSQKTRLRYFLSEKMDSDAQLYFQPLLDIHLFTDFNDGFSSDNGNIGYVRAFSFAALLLLIVAGLNYIILTTARSEKRNKEIALKKLFGSDKSWLIAQFLFETIIYTFAAQIFAIILFFITKPFFEDIVGKTIQLQFNHTTVLYFVASMFVISTLAGGYLSFYLSSLKPISLLSGFSVSGTKYHISILLTPLQLMVSIFFVLSALSIYKQLDYMQNKDQGMKLDNIVAVSTNGFIYQFEAIKKQLLQNANIYSVTASGGPPVDYHFNKGGTNWEGKNNDDNVAFSILTVDPSFLETFNIKLLQGDFLPSDMTCEDHFKGKNAFVAPIIINETALNLIGQEDPIGKKIDLGTMLWNGHIVGVVSDFHFKPLQYEISPMAMVYDPESFQEMYVKINPEKTAEMITYIKNVTEPFRQGKYVFDYYFVQDKMNLLYKKENNMLKFASFFTIVSVLLSLLGFFGMVSYSVARKRKTIAIRKVLGANTTDVVYLFIKQSVAVLSIGFVIALVFVWLYLNNWLQSYAYHITLSPFFFALVFAVAQIVIIGVTVLLVFNEANKNPKENLKYE